MQKQSANSSIVFPPAGSLSARGPLSVHCPWKGSAAVSFSAFSLHPSVLAVRLHQAGTSLCWHKMGWADLPSDEILFIALHTRHCHVSCGFAASLVQPKRDVRQCHTLDFGHGAGIAQPDRKAGHFAPIIELFGDHVLEVLEAKFSKMTAPNFWSNSLYGLSTVFNENRQTKGGPHKTPPRSDNLQHRHPFEVPNDHFEAKICRLEAKNRDFAIKIDDSDAKNDDLHAKIGHFEAKNCHLEAKFGHSQTKNKHFEGQNCQKRQNAGFGGQIFQNDSPQFLAKFFIWA